MTIYINWYHLPSYGQEATNIDCRDILLGDAIYFIHNILNRQLVSLQSSQPTLSPTINCSTAELLIINLVI